MRHHESGRQSKLKGLWRRNTARLWFTVSSIHPSYLDECPFCIIGHLRQSQSDQTTLSRYLEISTVGGEAFHCTVNKGRLYIHHHWCLYFLVTEYRLLYWSSARMASFWSSRESGGTTRANVANSKHSLQRSVVIQYLCFFIQIFKCEGGMRQNKKTRMLRCRFPHPQALHTHTHMYMYS